MFINLDEPDKKWELKTLQMIISLISGYCEKHSFEDVALVSVEDNTWSDPDNKRFDIWVEYTKEDKRFQQKLLILKGEILDGDEFHKRHDEFYPRMVS